MHCFNTSIIRAQKIYNNDFFKKIYTKQTTQKRTKRITCIGYFLSIHTCFNSLKTRCALIIRQSTNQHKLNKKNTVPWSPVTYPQHTLSTSSVLFMGAMSFNRIAPYARITESTFLAKASTAEGLLHGRSSSEVLPILIQSIFIPPTAKINCTRSGMPG